MISISIKLFILLNSTCLFFIFKSKKHKINLIFKEIQMLIISPLYLMGLYKDLKYLQEKIEN